MKLSYGCSLHRRRAKCGSCAGYIWIKRGGRRKRVLGSTGTRRRIYGHFCVIQACKTYPASIIPFPLKHADVKESSPICLWCWDAFLDAVSPQWPKAPSLLHAVLWSSKLDWGYPNTASLFCKKQKKKNCRIALDDVLKRLFIR